MDIKKVDIKKYKLYQEISAGGVVIKKIKGKNCCLVIHRNQMNDWSLPKGHRKKNESLQETAIREIKDETGIIAKPIRYLGKFTYSVSAEQKEIVFLRTVHWFLMKYKSGKLRRKRDREVDKVIWAPLEKDLSFLTYDNDRKFIRKAIKALKNSKNERAARK